MIMYDLPREFVINGNTYHIRNGGDYRAILDTIAAVIDSDMTENQRIFCALYIFYEEKLAERDAQEAAAKMMWFIGGGSDDNARGAQESKPLMDWEQDFALLAPPISKALGVQDIRAEKYIHWWTFLGGYMEIGECAFATIISIRKKLQKGKKLDKWEQEYLRDNRDKVQLKARLTSAEREWLEQDW